jgi:hypothetical protein
MHLGWGLKGMLAIVAAVCLLPLGSILVRYSKRHPSSDHEYLSFVVQTLTESAKALLSLAMYMYFPGPLVAQVCVLCLVPIAHCCALS